MIENLFLFSGLETQEIKKIISYLTPPDKFKKNEIIYSADNYKNALGMIISGKASAVTNNSDGVYMKSFTAGSVFGAAAVFGNNGSYISKIVAQTETSVQFIEEEILQRIFSEFPKTALNYIAFLSDKIRFLNQKLNMISCTNAEDTVYKYLIGIMDSENTVNIPVSMTLLAKMLGLGRATLYRSFDSLENSGRIKREKNIIKVI